jgi:hypothetical protein
LEEKDAQIIKLSMKEGELKGKDEFIATLSLKIEKLETALHECHHHSNPLQTLVDDLTTKNLELEV